MKKIIVISLLFPLISGCGINSCCSCANNVTTNLSMIGCCGSSSIYDAK